MKEEAIIKHNHLFNPVLIQSCSGKLKGEGIGIFSTPVFLTWKMKESPSLAGQPLLNRSTLMSEVEKQ